MVSGGDRLGRPLQVALLGAVLAFAVGCGQPSAPLPAAPQRAASRIVSLDYCADQFVLKLADRADILALSPDAGKRFAYLRAQAHGLPVVRPVAENILALQPDLIVRAYGGGAHAPAFFEAAGIPVLQLGFASDLESVKQLVSDMANGLGHPERGQALRAEIDRRLAELPVVGTPSQALYVTPGGVTSGTGTLIDELITRAGLVNYVEQAGWRSLPLEQLAYRKPDLLLSAFYETRGTHSSWWSVTRHPMLRRYRSDIPVVDLDGAWLTCGGWFMLDAIETMAAARVKLEP